MIPIICGFGLITNSFFLFILSSKSLKHKMYQNLWVKTFCDLIVCLVGVGYLNSECFACFGNQNSEYWIIYFQWYIRGIPQAMAFTASIYSEIYLILNRCINLFNPKSKLFEFRKGYFLFTVYLFSFCFNFPAYFMKEIKMIDNKFELVSKKFSGHSKGVSTVLFFQIFVIF